MPHAFVNYIALRITYKSLSATSIKTVTAKNKGHAFVLKIQFWALCQYENSTSSETKMDKKIKKKNITQEMQTAALNL